MSRVLRQIFKKFFFGNFFFRLPRTHRLAEKAALPLLADFCDRPVLIKNFSHNQNKKKWGEGGRLLGSRPLLISVGRIVNFFVLIINRGLLSVIILADCRLPVKEINHS